MKYCDVNQMDVFTGHEYIMIAAANSFGKDKLNWKDRLDWFTNNEADLYKDSTVQQAKEPYQFMKALYALRDAREGRSTGYLVGLDATCSGPQLMAAMSGCHTSAEKVNMTGLNSRSDMYTEMGQALGLDIDRDDLKEAIMTFFYASEKVPERVFGDSIGEFYKLMERELPGAYDVMTTLISCQDHINDSYRYQAPCGSNILIRQKVKVVDKLEIKSEVETLDNWYITQQRKEFGRKKMDKSIPANVTHTADAWLVRQTVKACHKLGFEVVHVHDCYFCSPNHMNKLRFIVKSLMAEFSKSNYLQDCVRSITGIEDYVYTKVSNDLHTEIMKSNYHIC